MNKRPGRFAIVAEPVRVSPGETLRDCARIAMRLIVGHLRLDRHHEVNAFAARHLWPGLQPFPFE
jgi:hypothetical protein